MPLIDFPYRSGNIYDDARNLLDLILRVGMKLQINEKDSLELSAFKQELLKWMNEELEKIGNKI